MTAAEQFMERGRVMERREVLLALLWARFGSLAPAAEARVLAADPEQLRQWLLRFATTATLAEVFEHEDDERDGLVPESEEQRAAWHREVLRAAAEQITEWWVEHERGRQLEEYKQGVEEGRVMARRDGLLEQLRARFGALDPAAEARVLAADPDQLKGWVLRFATVATLAEVFAEE